LKIGSRRLEGEGKPKGGQNRQTGLRKTLGGETQAASAESWGEGEKAEEKALAIPVFPRYRREKGKKRKEP